jgi:hypothetical protein
MSRYILYFPPDVSFMILSILKQSCTRVLAVYMYT